MVEKKKTTTKKTETKKQDTKKVAPVKQEGKKQAKAAAGSTTQQKARVGVFICHCGTNIAGSMDIQQAKPRDRRQPHQVTF